MMVQIPQQFTKEETAKFLIELAAKMMEGKCAVQHFDMDWEFEGREFTLKLVELR